MLVLYFLLFSFIGWVGDTAYRSFEKGTYVRGSFLPIPIMPIYGFGALLILFINTRLHPFPFFVKFFLYGSLLAALELATGFLVKKYFKRRLWKYDGGILNIGGFTNFAHVLLWGALAMILLYFQPYFEPLFGPMW
jgi:uncharacterized membrane protein